MTTTTMTTGVDLDRGRPGPMALVRSEFLKFRTTNGWWLFVLGALVLLLLTIAINWVQAEFAFNTPSSDLSPEDAAIQQDLSNPIVQAANLYTSGQFMGLMFVMLVGAIVVTNEFHHQTATTTFLATPHRTSVVFAKLAVAAAFGAGLWAVSLLINLPAGIGILAFYDQPTLLGEPDVLRSIGLNLVAYMLWGIVGVGLGVLIRSQIGATVIGTVLYLIGTLAVIILVGTLSNGLGWDWVEDAQYVFPSVASQLLVAGDSVGDQPPYWVGGLILLGWALVTGFIGTLITRKRDVS